METFKPKMLIVDDSKSALIVMQDLLSEFNLDLYVASSALEALEMFDSIKIDVAILDVNLPVMTGFELASQLRSKPAYAHIPLIFVSGTFTDKDYQLKGLKLGAIDYILKESLIEILPTKVHNILEVINYHHSLNNETLIHRDSYDEEIKAIIENSKIKNHVLMLLTQQMRSPITIINNSLSFLQNYSEKLEKSDYDRIHTRIKNAVNNMLELMEDSVIYTNTMNGFIKISYFPTVIDTFFKEYINELNEYFKTDLINLNLLSNSIQKAMLDQYHIKILLKILITNALKFSQYQKPVNVNIKTLQNNLVIEVEDSGIGIPEDFIPNLFTSFQRADNAISVEGNGLGLAIAKRIIDAMSGTIECTSDLYKGTKFLIIIPFE